MNVPFQPLSTASCGAHRLASRLQVRPTHHSLLVISVTTSTSRSTKDSGRIRISMLTRRLDPKNYY